MSRYVHHAIIVTGNGEFDRPFEAFVDLRRRIDEVIGENLTTPVLGRGCCRWHFIVLPDCISETNPESAEFDAKRERVKEILRADSSPFRVVWVEVQYGDEDGFPPKALDGSQYLD